MVNFVMYILRQLKKKTNPQRENKGEETSNRILKARNQTDQELAALGKAENHPGFHHRTLQRLRWGHLSKEEWDSLQGESVKGGAVPNRVSPCAHARTHTHTHTASRSSHLEIAASGVYRNLAIFWKMCIRRQNYQSRYLEVQKSYCILPLKIKAPCPGWVVRLIGASFLYAKVVGSISGQGIQKNKPMNA